MPNASILIKPASSGCNLACKYCFYHSIAEKRSVANYGIMSDEILEELVKQVIDYAEGGAVFAFQGGEPTLAGLDFFQKAVELQKKYNTKKINIQNTLQTNGTLIDEKWAEFLAENNFLIGLSLDGTRRVNDACRVSADGESTYERVMHTIKLFEKYHVDFNICTVVTAQAADKISSVYNFFRQHGFEYMQFIPCIDEKLGEHNEYSLNPKAYGIFLNKLFDLWYADFIKGKRVDIRMFSNFAQMSAGYPPEECGMCGECNTYFAVESDGSVYPCDFYTQDEWKLGAIEDGFQTLYESEKSQRFMRQSINKPEECAQCEYFRLCRGGCRRWRDFGQEYMGINYLCEGYKIFFKHCGDRIHKLGEYINMRMR